MIATVSFQGKPMRIYGVHLASEAGSADADAQRVAQASLVRRDMLTRIMEGRDLIIIAGDMNDGRGQPAIRRIRGYDDLWPDLIETGDTRYFPEEKWDTRWTYAYQGERNQIDHILLSRAFLDVVADKGIQAMVSEQTDPLASDHRPFVLR